jgi:hypothetical protein
MRHSKRFWLLPSALTFVSVVGVVWLTVAQLTTPKVTRSNCERIRQGMTEKEVDAILGDAKYSVVYGNMVPPWWCYCETGRQPPWESHRIYAIIFFENGKVEKIDVHDEERNWKSRLTDWLPW